MKTNTRSLIIAVMAVVLPISALRAADACCPKEAGKAAKAESGCSPTPAAAPVQSAFGAPPAAPRSGDMPEADAAFLAGYEILRAALSADDFAAAQKAAEELDSAEAIATAKSLAEARVAFKAVSVKAIAMAKGRPGFYLAHCPMVKGGGGDWVQISKKISNPYYGSQMLTCGSIKG